MNRIKSLAALVILMLLLLACTATEAQYTVAPDIPFPLSEPGPYQFGTRMRDRFTDSSRGDRKISVYIWYPAVLPADAEPSIYNRNAEPDLSEAPYPVILSSAKTGMYFGSHLATYGFIVIGVDQQDSKDNWGNWLIDYPLDQVKALEQVAANPPEGMEGMVDGDRAGAMGYSFGGYNALALSGARVDPDFYQAQCAEAEPGDPAPKEWWIDYICNLDEGWEAFVSQAGPAITDSTDGLWQPLTNSSIRAVMPMVPEGAWLFGERGLAAVDRPTLILAGTADDINYYDLEATYIYDHLGTFEKSMISFVDRGHMMIFDDEQVKLIKHFATAFFSYYLQGREDFAEYFSEDYINQLDDLAWGVYK